MAKRQLPDESAPSHESYDDILHTRAVKQNAPTFTLVAWDRTAPGTIRDWALRAARAGAPAEKIGTALIRSVAFEEWQVRHGSKIPD